MNYFKIKDNRCMTTEILYKATVTTTDGSYEYIGCTAPYLIVRLANHDKTFRNSSLEISTGLRKFIW